MLRPGCTVQLEEPLSKSLWDMLWELRSARGTSFQGPPFELRMHLLHAARAFATVSPG